MSKKATSSNQAFRNLNWIGYYIFASLVFAFIGKVWSGAGDPFLSYLSLVSIILFTVGHAFTLLFRGQNGSTFGLVIVVVLWLLFGFAWWLSSVSEFMTVILALNVIIVMAIQMMASSAIQVKARPQKTYANPAQDSLNDDELDDGEAESFLYPALPSKVSFSDVVGMSETKTQLRAALDAALDEKDGRNGIMLSGKPGNGKTMLANALAGQANLPIISISFGDIASKWVNQTSEQVKRVFEEALAQAPCVLFMDEIDSVMPDRSTSMSSDSEAPKITNLMLTELVNTRNTGVLIVAATNYLDRLDEAAVRAGRFDFKIEIPMPDSPARRAILENTLRNSALKRGSGAMVSSDKTLDRITKRWEGFSCATLAGVAKAAVDIGYKHQSKSIDFPMWMEALRKVQGDARRLPEGTPTIEQLVCNAPLRADLKSLSMRLSKIEEIEDLGGSVPNGVLFYGPPGTGKTLTARALAKSSGWAFLSTTGNALLRDPKIIDELKTKASNLRPCIVFIDEADDALADRGASPHTTTVTNKLLAAIDGADGKIPDVIFVAATNNRHMMDSAALRGGRFTEKVEFELPTQETILGLIKMWQKKSVHDLSHIHSEMAEALNGESTANIMAVLQASLNEIAIRHINGDRSEPKLEDFHRGYAQVLG